MQLESVLLDLIEDPILKRVLAFRPTKLKNLNVESQESGIQGIMRFEVFGKENTRFAYNPIDRKFVLVHIGATEII